MAESDIYNALKWQYALRTYNHYDRAPIAIWRSQRYRFRARKITLSVVSQGLGHIDSRTGS